MGPTDDVHSVMIVWTILACSVGIMTAFTAVECWVDYQGIKERWRMDDETIETLARRPGPYDS